ncbi:MaoC/PaaZ C-terminal domain-containing protein [Dietzia sp. NPDC055343]
MTDSDHEFRFDLLEQWSDTVVFHATREHIAAFAAATNDDHPAHASGDVAPPVYAVVPVFQTMARTTMEAVPGELQMKILHGEQEMRYTRQITAGDELHCRAKVVGIHGRSSGVVVTTYVETTDPAGALVNEQYFSGFFRGGRLSGGHGVEAPQHQLDPALRDRACDAEVVQTFDEDQTYRYAEASGDTMPIHTDAEFAKSVGLPGIIIHGLCTMAFVSRAAVQAACPDDPSRLTRLAVRFSAPAFPGSTITTRLWRAGDGSWAFETAAQDGSVVIKDGAAEVAH